MRQLQDLAQDRADMDTIVQLTSAFEQLASMRIAQIKNQVLQAQEFFDELWHIYAQIRVDSLFRFGRQHTDVISKKELYIIISAAGGFSGDIDQRLITEMLKDYNKDKQDIVVVGRHGARLLAQMGISFEKYFALPQKDNNINVEPLVREIRQYPNTVVYYQTYESLMMQSIKHIELNAAIKELGEQAGAKNREATDTINEKTYIFEPSSFEVIAYLERSMLQITLSQVIFDSKLAQYASRFRAMTVANDRAGESLSDLSLLYNQSRRALRDERLKQIINGLKKASVA